MSLKKIQLFPQSDQPLPITDSVIQLTLEPLPKEQRESAKKILNYLKESEVLTTSEGRIYYESMDQSGSYLWYILSYFLPMDKAENQKQPTDAAEFLKILKEAEVPEELLSNDKLKLHGDHMQNVKWISLYE